MNRVLKNKTFRLTGLAIGLTVAATSSALAHPGHGQATTVDSGTSATHYVTEPVHALTLIAVAAFISLTVGYASRRCFARA